MDNKTPLPPDEALDDEDAVRVRAASWNNVGLRLTGTDLEGDGVDVIASTLHPGPSSVVEVVVGERVVTRILLDPDAVAERDERREELADRLDDAVATGVISEAAQDNLHDDIVAGRLDYVDEVLTVAERDDE